MPALLRPFVLASAIALSSVGFASSPSVLAPVAFPGGIGYIVTSENGGITGNYDLILWVRIGSNWTVQKRLTDTTRQDDTSPSYSGSGKRVVFVRNGDIWVVTNAGNTTRLTNSKVHDSDPTFTPDGSIVWTAGTRLHEMAADGSHKMNLGIPGRTASVSADGTWVAYTRHDRQRAADHIFKAHLDGTHVVDLTPRATTDQQNADWSPDGKHLVFQQLNPRTHHFRIAVMRADGSHLGTLASNARWDLTDPAYAPTGGKVAYRQAHARFNGQRTGSIDILDLTTRQIVVLPDGGGRDVKQPTWQPT